MTRSVKPWVRRTALPLLALAGLGAAPLASATELPAPAPVPASAATEAAKPVTKAAAAKLAALDASEAAFATTTTTQSAAAAAGDSRGFFKTRKGAVALVLLAGGLGYTIYSFSHDRVSSPQR